MTLDSKAKEKQTKTQKESTKQMAQLVQCISIASSTPEGIIAFRQIMLICGYNKSVVTANPQTGDINLNGTLYNAARENLWKEIRQFIPIRTRKKIEYGKTIFTEGNSND